VVIVPNIRQNPIDLLIADHCSHFDADSLDRLLRFRAAGDGPHPARDPQGIDRSVLIFDEYAIPAWAGESAAVDEFLARTPEARLKTFAWTNVPGAYLVKP
jgi:hypothetical protein